MNTNKCSTSVDHTNKKGKDLEKVGNTYYIPIIAFGSKKMYSHKS